MGGSTPKEPEIDYKGLEQTYEGWLSDAERTRRQQAGATQSRLASSGMRKDTPEWTRAMNQVQIDYEEEIKFINDTTTSKIVRDFRRAQKKSAQRQAWLAKRREEGKDTSGRIGSRLGAWDIPQARDEANGRSGNVGEPGGYL